jgi:hypothetical protein
MRMRADIDSMPRLELRGSKMIEKNERPYHGLRLRRQYAAHAESTQIALPRIDQP